MPRADERSRGWVRPACWIGVALGCALFVVGNLSALGTASEAAGRANVAALIVGLTLSVAAMANRGLLNHAAHRSVGLAPTAGEMTRTSAVGFAANKVIRTGGASGLAVFLHHGKHRGFSRSRVTASCVIASAASLAALGVLLFVTIGLLFASGKLTPWWLAACIGFCFYGLGLVIFARRAASSQERLTWWWSRALLVRNRLTRSSREIDSSGIDEVFAAFALARRNRPWTRRTLGHAVMSKALGAAMLLAGAAAAGVPVSTTGAITIYAAALAASFVSLVPAGVGVVEASTGAMFVSSGAPLAVAVVAVALYRIFDLWLPVLTGLLLGRREFRGRPAAPSSIQPELDREQLSTPCVT